MTKTDLINKVNLAINPEFQDWVLFEHGTYIILENINEQTDIENEARELIKEFGPVLPGGPSGDFTVIHLTNVEGWVVSGHGYGMYTYVSPSELKSNNPDDVEIGVYGRSKRDMDSKSLKIIHLNRREK